MPPELLELDPQIEAMIARANAGLGLAEEQPVIFGWEADAPEFAQAAADHDGLSTGLFGGAAGQVFSDKPAVVLNIGAEAHA